MNSEIRCAIRMAKSILTRSVGHLNPGSYDQGLALSSTPEGFLFHHALTFFHCHYLVHIRGSDFIYHTTRPANFNQVNLCSFFETEVKPQIILRNVAPSATYL